jgi:hypothetical protein
MSQAEKKGQEIIEDKPSAKSKAGKIRLEKRKKQKDRRETNTYLSDDRRSGIADRRKKR